MELINVHLSDHEVAARSAIVRQSDLGLGRVPEPPEGVVIHALDQGTYFAGIIDAWTEPESFRLKLGPRIPEHMAMSRVTGFPVPASPFRSQPVADIALALRSHLVQDAG